MLQAQKKEGRTKRPERRKARVVKERWREKRTKRLSKEGVRIRFLEAILRIFFLWRCSETGFLVVALVVRVCVGLRGRLG